MGAVPERPLGSNRPAANGRRIAATSDSSDSEDEHIEVIEVDRPSSRQGAPQSSANPQPAAGNGLRHQVQRPCHQFMPMLNSQTPFKAIPTIRAQSLSSQLGKTSFAVTQLSADACTMDSSIQACYLNDLYDVYHQWLAARDLDGSIDHGVARFTAFNMKHRACRFSGVHASMSHYKADLRA